MSLLKYLGMTLYRNWVEGRWLWEGGARASPVATWPGNFLQLLARFPFRLLLDRSEEGRHCVMTVMGAGVDAVLQIAMSLAIWTS